MIGIMLRTPKAPESGAKPALPRRPLGRTREMVTLFGLGGEGVLRTHGRMAEAVRVIHRALDHGVNYFDTAPAYDSSMDYYGEALGDRREEIFLACKTHDRSRDGSLKLLDQSLERLKTDYLDLWQLHDLRTIDHVDRIFAKGGAMEALIQARAEGRVRFLGITGHYDPKVLLEALHRFDFDTMLVALNAADIHRRSFIQAVLPHAVRFETGVIGMKVAAAGALIGRGKLVMAEAMNYTLSLPGVSLVIVGCKTPAEVDQNVEIVRRFHSLSESEMHDLEERTRRKEELFTSYKKGR
jgi:aryl-alcohol dehydrogenase-like predicted oxidoreductase